METHTFAQALRNAVGTERAAATFYEQLGGLTDDPAAREFFARMVEAELRHAASIEALAAALGVELPEHAEPFAASVETAPAWAWSEGLSFVDALHVALEAETHACLFYDAVADGLTGPAREVFERLSTEESAHAAVLREHLARVEPK